MARRKSIVPADIEVPIRTFGVDRSFLRAASRLVDLVPHVPRPLLVGAGALAGDLWWIGHDMRVVIAKAKASALPEPEPSTALTPDR